MVPKVKFLVTVWGGSYIERFLSLALPSYLAPDNLPALAASTELEVVIMTSKEDIALFETDFVFRQVNELCRIRFIPIDDLIATGCYGVSLTLAYGRAIISLGEDMRSTHFVFMNADFILADGSLRSLIRHILDGRSVIVAPSFRAVAEDIAPRLGTMVNPGKGILTITPRELVRLALNHNHPTNIAKTVNQNFCHMINPNQFFWQVDDQTVIGRHFLVFMLCLKPERVISKINSYCDYGFIPEMCPSEDMVVLHDSDDIFMLELAGLDQESQLIRVGGQLPVKDLAKTLSQWTTREHRELARHTMLFHAGDLPLSLKDALSEASRFMDQLHRFLSGPKSHRFHTYWSSGVDAWREQRRRQHQQDEAPEIESEPFLLRSRQSGFFRQSGFLKMLACARKLLLGLPPKVSPLHWTWYDYHMIKTQVSEKLDTPGRILCVSNHDMMGSWLADLAPCVRFQRVELLEFLASPDKFISSTDSHTHDLYICYLSRKELHLGGKIIDAVRPDLSKCAELVIFADDLSSIGQEDLAKLLSLIMTKDLKGCSVSFVGGEVKYFITRSARILARGYVRYGIKSLPYVVPILTFLLIMSALNNIFLILSGKKRRVVTPCSSLVIHVKEARAGTFGDSQSLGHSVPNWGRKTLGYDSPNS